MKTAKEWIEALSKKEREAFLKNLPNYVGGIN